MFEAPAAAPQLRPSAPGAVRMHSPTHPLQELALVPIDTDPAEPLDERPGCGWFESSFELQRGLQVTEHQGLEPLWLALPAAWPLQ